MIVEDTENNATSNGAAYAAIIVQALGILTWIVFMALKFIPGLSPEFAEAVSLFWVFFPLWIFPATVFATIIIVTILGIIAAVYLSSKIGNEDE